MLNPQLWQTLLIVDQLSLTLLKRLYIGDNSVHPATLNGELHPQDSTTSMNSIDGDVDSTVTNDEDIEFNVMEPTKQAVLPRRVTHACHYNLWNQITIPKKYQ